MMKNIAVLGLGNMGAAIAEKILKAGYGLTLYNRTPDKMNPFMEKGAKDAATPAEAAKGADVIISVVGDDAASRNIWLGEAGALAAAPKGCIVVECSTLSLDWVRELNRLATSQGLRFVDAGLGGGPASIPAGTLNLFVGAEQETFDIVKPLLAVFSAEQFRFGPAGTGMAYKLINNMMIDVQVSALCEGLAMAERSGVDMKEAGRAIIAGAAASGAVVSNLAGILAQAYEPPSFRLRWMRKDAAYMEKFSDEKGLELPVAKAARSLLEDAASKGWLDRNWTIVAELYRNLK